MAFSFFHNKKGQFSGGSQGKSSDSVAQDIFLVVGAVVLIVLVVFFVRHLSSLSFEVKYSQDEEPIFDDLGRLRTDIHMNVTKEEALNFRQIGFIAGGMVFVVFIFVFGILSWSKNKKKKQKIPEKEFWEESENSPPGLS